MPFFNNLQKHEMPPSMLRMEHCMVQTPDKVGIFFIPGPCHIQKNLASQLRSSGRTIKFGHLRVDFAAAVDLGLPGPGNFCMRDSVYTYTIYIHIYIYIYIYMQCPSLPVRLRTRLHEHCPYERCPSGAVAS